MTTTGIWFVPRVTDDPSLLNYISYIQGVADEDALSTSLSLKSEAVDATKPYSEITSSATSTRSQVLLQANQDSGAYVQVLLDSLLERISLFGGTLGLAAVTSDPSSPIDGQIWYRSDTDVFRVRMNGVTKTLSTSAAVTKTVISTMSRESIGVDLAADGSGVNTGTWPDVDRAILVPFQIEESVTFTKMGFRVVVQSGNYDIGIYNEDYSKQVSIGTTTVPAVGMAEANIADTTLAAGRYYFALAFDNTTVSIARSAPGAVAIANMMGLAQMNSAFPLPSTFTPAAVTSSYAPIIAASIRTLLG